MSRLYKNIVDGFDIVTPAGVNNEMIEYAKKGALKGKYLGYPEVQEHYTMALGGVTDWTGFPQSGKSEVVMDYLLNTSIYYGWKHLVYLPDSGNEKEIIADLLHKLTGKTFDKRFKNLITDFEITSELPWLLEHFKILTKKDLKKKLTPYQFWDLAAKLKDEEGLHTATIDAWKDMHHDTQKFGRDDKYLEDVLSYRNAIAEKHNIHLHTVVHPLKTDKDNDGNRKPPSPYDLKGGTEWYNNGKCMVTVHRPSGEKNMVEIYWNKIKPRSIGSTGMSVKYFDIALRKYYWFNDPEDHSVEGRTYAQEKYFKPNKDKVSAIVGDSDDDVPF